MARQLREELFFAASFSQGGLLRQIIEGEKCTILLRASWFILTEEDLTQLKDFLTLNWTFYKVFQAYHKVSS